MKVSGQWRQHAMVYKWHPQKNLILFCIGRQHKEDAHFYLIVSYLPDKWKWIAVVSIWCTICSTAFSKQIKLVLKPCHLFIYLLFMFLFYSVGRNNKICTYFMWCTHTGLKFCSWGRKHLVLPWFKGNSNLPKHICLLGIIYSSFNGKRGNMLVSLFSLFFFFFFFTECCWRGWFGGGFCYGYRFTGTGCNQEKTGCWHVEMKFGPG